MAGLKDMHGVISPSIALSAKWSRVSFTRRKCEISRNCENRSACVQRAMRGTLSSVVSRSANLREGGNCNWRREGREGGRGTNCHEEGRTDGRTTALNYSLWGKMYERSRFRHACALCCTMSRMRDGDFGLEWTAPSHFSAGRNVLKW